MFSTVSKTEIIIYVTFILLSANAFNLGKVKFLLSRNDLSVDINYCTSQAEEDLEHAQLQWGDFETKFDACSHWLKNMEQQVKNYELRSTLPEKKAQVEKFKVLLMKINHFNIKLNVRRK